MNTQKFGYSLNLNKKGQKDQKGPELVLSQLAITCSKLTIETREQGVKYVQS